MICTQQEWSMQSKNSNHPSTHLILGIIRSLGRRQRATGLRALLRDDARVDPRSHSIVLMMHAREEAHVGRHFLARIQDILRLLGGSGCCVGILGQERRHVLRQRSAIRLARRRTRGRRPEQLLQREIETMWLGRQANRVVVMGFMRSTRQEGV